MKLVRTIFWIVHPLNNYAVSNKFWNMIEYFFELILVEKILRGGSADVLDEICESRSNPSTYPGIIRL